MARRKVPLRQAIDAFLLARRVEGRSSRTVEWYGDHLARFLRFLPANTTLDDLTVDQARAFIAHLQTLHRWEEGDSPHHPDKTKLLSPFTIRGYARTLKVFGSWLASEGYSKESPFARLVLPKAPKLRPPTMTTEQIRDALAATRGNQHWQVRDYALIVVLLDTGLRVSELCNLTLARTDLEQGWITVIGKGAKERKVPLGLEARRALSRYITLGRPDSTEPYTFLTEDGQPLKPDRVRLVFGRLKKKLGITEIRFSPHTLRHTAATNFLRGGGDVFNLKRLLGHADLKTTEQYLDLLDADLKAAHEKASPLDRLFKDGKQKG